MAIMDKIFFWRHGALEREAEVEKAADLALGKDRALGLGEEQYEAGHVPPAQPPETLAPEHRLGPMPEEEPSFNAPKPSAFQAAGAPNKDMEIISAKLDALKATLDNINHRLENIERIAREGI